MEKSWVTSQTQIDSCPFLALLYLATLVSDIVEALGTKQRVTVAAQIPLLCQVLQPKDPVYSVDLLIQAQNTNKSLLHYLLIKQRIPKVHSIEMI